MRGDLPIVDPQIESYLSKIGPAPHPVLVEMEAYARERGGFPVVGPLIGRFLEQLSRGVGAKTVLEYGSGFGYSAFWFALAVGEGGKVILTEYDEGNAERARDFLGRAGLLPRVEIRVGDAIEATSQLAGPLDVVFLDLEKERYPQAFRAALPLLRPGGLLVADNLLWGGSVVRGDPDAATEGLREYTKLAMESAELLTTIVPLGDGLGVSLKLDPRR